MWFYLSYLVFILYYIYNNTYHNIMKANFFLEILIIELLLLDQHIKKYKHLKFR